MELSVIHLIVSKCFLQQILSIVSKMRSALFWVFTHHIMVISYRRFETSFRTSFKGQEIQDSLNLEDGTNRLSRNVCEVLQLQAT